jgi:hypothetical protein
VTDDGTLVAAATGGGFKLYCDNDCEEWRDYDGMDYDGDWPTAEEVNTYLAGLPKPKRKGGR